MKSVVLTLLAVLFSGVAMADNIAVQNASFEDSNPLDVSCGSGCAYNSGPIPSWTVTGGQSGSAMLDSSLYTSIPDGSLIAYTNGGTISQTLTGISLLPDSIYTLSVYVGNRFDQQITDYSFSLLAGSSVLNTFSGSNGTITPGTFEQEFLTYTTGSIVTAGDLGIQLSSAGGQGDFDDVQLTVVPVENDFTNGDPVSTPEPSSLLMLGMGLLGITGLAVRKQAVV